MCSSDLGDHGGGPTRDMLLKARRWQDSPFFPAIKFSTPGEFLAAVFDSEKPGEWAASIEESSARDASSDKQAISLPLWNDELYLELHRGCYTAHSDQKQQNRRGEDLLYQAEVWATVAQLVTGQPYPQEKLETAWKALLFNQFHDILPGSSIPEVFEDANREWGMVLALGQEVLVAALETLAKSLTVPDGQQPLVVFNAHSWARTELVSVMVPSGAWQIVDCETNQIIESAVDRGDEPFGEPAAGRMLSFVAEDVPAVGYRLYSLMTATQPANLPVDELVTKEFTLENEQLRVVISPETGDIISCIHQIGRAHV